MGVCLKCKLDPCQCGAWDSVQKKEKSRGSADRKERSDDETKDSKE